MFVKSSGSGWHVRLASASVTVAVTGTLAASTIVSVVGVGIVPMKVPAGIPGTCEIGCPGSKPAVLATVTVVLVAVIAPTMLIGVAGDPTAVNKIASFQSPVVVIANDVPAPENFGNNRMLDMASQTFFKRSNDGPQYAITYIVLTLRGRVSAAPPDAAIETVPPKYGAGPGYCAPLPNSGAL